MKKNTIVHFVGFVTPLELGDFAPAWERYAKRFTTKKKEPCLQQHITDRRNKLSFLSRHEWDEPGANFSFMDGRKSEHFPELNVRVVQLGGYQLLDAKKIQHREDDTKFIVFLDHRETDINFYRQLPCRHLQVNQAYYESCLYGYVLEIIVAESGAEELLLQLNQRDKAEIGLYRECLLTPA